MSRAHRQEHASHVIALYNSDFGAFPQEVYATLQQREFSRLPDKFFHVLKENGYGIEPNSVPSLDDLLAGSQAGLDAYVIGGFNIFGSGRQDAVLSIVKNQGLFYVFLTAQYTIINPGLTQPETFPICAVKRFYGQPLLLQEVIKRVDNGRRHNPQKGAMPLNSEKQ